MKIAMLIELFWPYEMGGGERQFYELARHLARKHEVHVYTCKLRNTHPEETREGIHIHRIGWFAHPLDRRSLLPLPFYLFFLLFTRLPEDTDLIHCNAYAPCLVGFLKGKLHGKPVTAVIHDIYKGTWREALRSRLLGLLGELLEEIVCRLPYHAIVTVSGATKEYLMELFGIPEGRIHVCGSGIDVNFIDSIQRKKVKNRIIYVGRLVPHKHVEDLIGAMKHVGERVPEAECKIVGGGVLMENLQRMAREPGLDKVEFLGELPSHEEVIALMKSSEVLVLPSSREGFGLVVLEAMRCRTVPVVYELPCYRDFCSEEEVVFVPQRNVERLAGAVVELLQNREKLRRMAERGFEKAGEYDWSKFAEKVEKVFEKVGCKA